MISGHSKLSSVLSILLLLCAGSSKAGSKKTSLKPHIIIVLADDIGWNDFSFHGSNQIPTPNIDALAYHGITMKKHYTHNSCTPSRAALLTGNYPIRSGLQGSPISAGENRFIPENMTTIPEHLKKLGYHTHMVGKWHLGAAYKKYTPKERGFDTHFGYWNGYTGYFNHLHWRSLADGSVCEGHDFYDQFTPAWNVYGKYATDLFTERALRIIGTHNKFNKGTPLFLYISHLAGHTGFDGLELGVQNITEVNRQYGYIKDERRRRYADIVNRLDDSVGQVVQKLSRENMLNNSVLLFLTDNGAQTRGIFANAGSNWPLRGQKQFDFEGGIRGTAILFSPLLENSGYINEELIYIGDWLPTLYKAAGGNLKDLGKIDGISQWETLSENKETERKEILTSLNEVVGFSGLISEKGRFKFVNGSNVRQPYIQYYGDDGRGPEVPLYDTQEILNSSTNKAIEQTLGAYIETKHIIKIRSMLDLSPCRKKGYKPVITCSKIPCLFDLENDPCETKNIALERLELSQKMWSKIKEFLKVIVPQTNKPFDPKSDPVNYNNTWCTWLDDSVCFKTPKNSGSTI